MLNDVMTACIAIAAAAVSVYFGNFYNPEYLSVNARISNRDQVGSKRSPDEA